MTYTASDVPARIDVLIAGEGYRFLETDDVKGISSFAPTFLQRTNVGDAYDDHDQDWWLTMTQRDWSLGEGQRYFTPADQDAPRRYWKGSTLDGGQAGVLRLDDGTIVGSSAAANVAAACDMVGAISVAEVKFATSTTLYRIDSSGSIASDGVHGLGAAPSTFGMCSDGTSVYLSTTSGGSVGVRRHDGAAYTTFSASGADSLAFLNNTLYGYRESSADLVRWSTGGTLTSLFTWQTATGAAQSVRTRMIPYGGDLLILRGNLGSVSGATTGQPASVWIYDGVAPAKVADLPADFDPWDCTVLNGAVFIIGIARGRKRGAYSGYPAVYVYTGGNITRLWVSDNSGNAGHGGICAFGGNLYFGDGAAGYLMRYTPETGAIENVSQITTASQQRLLVSRANFHAVNIGATATWYYPASTKVSSGYVQTSLFDGSTSRTKRFKSVVVEFDAGSGGNGGSVDIAYRLNDVDGSYTSLQTGITSGTEYAIGQNGRAISIQVTINRGTSTTPPQIRRIYVRAAPLLDTFRKERYVLDLTGVDGEQMIQMRDGQTVHPKDGLAMATDLRTAIASTSPITVVDEFGSYTAFLVPEECEIRRVRSQEYTAVITAREV